VRSEFACKRGVQMLWQAGVRHAKLYGIDDPGRRRARRPEGSYGSRRGHPAGGHRRGFTDITGDIANILGTRARAPNATRKRARGPI